MADCSRWQWERVYRRVEYAASTQDFHRRHYLHCRGRRDARLLGRRGLAINAKMGAPWGLAIDSSGALFISDDITGDDFDPDAVRIRKVTPDGIITTIAGIGAPGLSPDTGDGGPATNAQFAVSGSLAVDAAGNLYVADYLRIRKVSPDGIITTVAGNGSLGYSGMAARRSTLSSTGLSTDQRWQRTVQATCILPTPKTTVFVRSPRTGLSRQRQGTGAIVVFRAMADPRSMRSSIRRLASRWAATGLFL